MLDTAINGAAAIGKIAAWAALQEEVATLNTDINEKYPATMKAMLDEAVLAAEYAIGEATNNDEAMAADAMYQAAEAASLEFGTVRDALIARLAEANTELTAASTEAETAKKSADDSGYTFEGGEDQ